ncbi:MAG: class I SAM-dependent methyltransferase [Ignavibacteriales bacterium]|nr:class I SAM-dependent methyltransferase [Ignavibacteriales bacterium]
MPAEPFKFDGVLDEWKSNQILRFCNKSALDIGCNTGELVSFLNSRNIYTEGLDSNQEFIYAARKKYSTLHFNCGSDLSIFKDNQFESVIAWNVIEHIHDDLDALHQMVRIASHNVILSIPKEDELSLPDSRVTYRPYVDPTHKHYYTRDILLSMVSQIGPYITYFEDTTRVRPLLAYQKIGIPRWLCASLDTLFWKFGSQKELFHANIMMVVEKKYRA